MEEAFDTRAEIEMENVIWFSVLAHRLVRLDKQQIADLHDMLYPEFEERNQPADKKGKKMQMLINAAADIAQALADSMQPQIKEYLQEYHKKKEKQGG